MYLGSERAPGASVLPCLRVKNQSEGNWTVDEWLTELAQCFSSLFLAAALLGLTDQLTTENAILSVFLNKQQIS